MTTAQEVPATDVHPLPSPFSSSSLHQPVLISQGAEALLYRTTYLRPSLEVALKYRPPKPYRHQALDRRLTRQRILAEARILVRCGREGSVQGARGGSKGARGLRVPAVWGLSTDEGWLALGWVRGQSVKDVLRSIAEERRGFGGVRHAEERQQQEGKMVARERGRAAVGTVLRKVGAAVGALHSIGIVHGDLTSSNMILSPSEKDQKEEGDEIEGTQEAEEIVLIDFGLASTSTADEDRAVDLYVLERAFGSTHPELEGVFAQELLAAYEDSYRGAKVVLKRLEDVRMRGRKKSMIG